MKRLKNYGMWLAIFAFLPILATTLNTYDITLVLPENYKELYIAILGILVLAGIINDPNTENHGYKDED